MDVSAGPVSDEAVRAAGGLIRRAGTDGTTEILLVHRPRYDDWSFPKGKLIVGESELDAAIREVREETGLTCRLGREIGTTSYLDSLGRTKTVRYWEMEPVDGVFVPTKEIDELRWVPVAAAGAVLSYQHDRELLDRLSPGDTAE